MWDQLKENMNEVDNFKQLLKTGNISSITNFLKKKKNKEVILNSVMWDTFDLIIMGDLDEPLNIMELLLKVDQELHVPNMLQNIYYIRSYVFSFIGKIDQALDDANKSLKMFQDQNDFSGIVTMSNMLGYYHYLQGNFVKALVHLDSAQSISKENNFRIGLAFSYYNRAKIFKSRNEIGESLELFLKSLNLFYSDLDSNDGQSSKEAELGKAVTLFQLILIFLSQGKIQEAEKYFSQFYQLDSENLGIKLRKRLSKALILKNRTRSKHKVEAQSILETIFKEKIIDHEMTIIAMFNLCELLLDELGTYGENEVLIEIEKLLQKLYEVAQNYNSQIILIEVLVLQSRLALLKGDITNANKLLDQASTLIEKKDLGVLATRIENEKNYLRENLKKWEILTQTGMTLSDRLKQTEMQEYIKIALENLKSFRG
jgi:tetratricopeptide (TPR) repeat protein